MTARDNMNPIETTLTQFIDQHRPQQEAFLAENLGGRFEEVGDAFSGAVLKVPSGVDEVPGLAEAVKSLKPSE